MTVINALRHAATRNHDFHPAGCSGCAEVQEILTEADRPCNCAETNKNEPDPSQQVVCSKCCPDIYAPLTK